MPAKTPVIGVFGGSFNPPHLGHLLAAVYALQQYELDQVWIVPAYGHAFGKELLPFSHRKNMCTALFKNMGKKFKVVDIDRQIENPGKTVFTLKALQRQHPSKRFRWIIGSDLVMETKSWYQVAKIQERFGFLVVPRALGNSKDFAIPNVNSTQIRKALAKKDLVDVITPPVLDYIQRNNLYVR